MPAKIRLARHGRKRYAYYHIVVADSRAPRDGRYIERIGSYNPNTNPATIDLDFDKALDWLQKGAQPTDTTKAILSYKGVIFKNHLLGGVKKGAFSEEEAEKRFDAWLAEKDAKIQAKKDRLAGQVESALNKQLEAETKIKDERSTAIAARDSKLAAEAEAARAEAKAEAQAEIVAEVEAPAEEPVAEVEAPAEEPVTEVEAPVEEPVTKVEAPNEEPTVVAEVETPVEEPVADVEPAKETAEEKKAEDKTQAKE
ncbi:MAG: 30S ribosomal protein S16 [Mariniphaga sp.]|nr:30S ribosomal protein S16 [Mariniphaga sp.]